MPSDVDARIENNFFFFYFHRESKIRSKCHAIDEECTSLSSDVELHTIRAHEGYRKWRGSKRTNDWTSNKNKASVVPSAQHASVTADFIRSYSTIDETRFILNWSLHVRFLLCIWQQMCRLIRYEQTKKKAQRKKYQRRSRIGNECKYILIINFMQSWNDWDYAIFRSSLSFILFLVCHWIIANNCSLAYNMS